MKEKIANSNLLLQNLIYEKKYLLNQIKICQNFQPQTEISSLISFDEMNEISEKFGDKFEFPSLPSSSSSLNENQTFKLRLHFELAERRRLFFYLFIYFILFNLIYIYYISIINSVFI